jgi:hypothetical protein
MLLALGQQTPWIEFDCVPVARVSPCGPLGEACAVLELDRLVSLVGHEPGPVWVVLADGVAVLAHERMFAWASSGFRSSRTKKSGCPLTFVVVKGVPYSGASGQGSYVRVRHGPWGSDKPRLPGASLHDAG